MFKSVAAVLSVASLVAAVPATIKAPEGAGSTLVTRNTGLGTVYLQGGVAGSCGVANADSSLIAALGNSWMNYEYQSQYCGRQIRITNIGSNSGTGGAGNSVTVTVQDTCQACDANHVDLSVGAWNALTNSAAYGTINIDWSFV